MNQHPSQFERDYHDQRWRQLNGLIIAHSEGALGYLLAVNGGAVAGMLAFIGAVNNLRGSPLALWALALFAVGLVLAGFTRAHALEAMKALQKGWMKDYGSFVQQQITWAELIRRDNERVSSWERWGPVLGYASGGCFLAGLVVATWCIWHLPAT